MKKIRLHIILILIVGCLAVLCACETTPAFAAPDDLEIDDTTLTLTWDEVKDALLYTVRIEADGQEPQEFVVSKTYYDLSNLKEGTYRISVKANGKEEVIEDSPWSEPLPFDREAEPGMVFTLIEGGTAYEVTNKGIATGDIVIPDTYRKKPVTRIGEKAFFNKGDVTSIKMGDNITEIGRFAFANCSYLTSIKLSKNLTALGESAFASCRLLEGILTLPEGLTELPENAFAYCAKLSEVRFGSRLTAIGANAFTDCAGLTSLNLPDLLKQIGEYAFAGCEKLNAVTFTPALESIGAYAFSGNIALTAVTLPDSLKSIGEGAFFTCTALESVTLGSGIEVIDLGAFMDTALWTNNAENEVYVGKWFLGLKDATKAPEPLRNDTVGIANYAFYRNVNLRQHIIPDSVKIIGMAAYAGSSVMQLVIGSGVETIGEQAFIGCKDLATAILGSYDFETRKMTASNLKVIGSYAFRDCTSLTEIEIPDRVKEIGSYAFRDSGIYQKAEEGVVYAGNWIVDYTDALSGSVIAKDNTVGVSNYAFFRCNGLTSIELPGTVKTVGRSAFYNCAQLISVKLPDTLEVIEDYTFYHCDKLQLFTLPPLLKSIGRSAFYKCGTVYLPDSLMDGDEDTFVIPDSVESIGDFAFYGNGKADVAAGGDVYLYGLDIIRLGNGVKTIGKNAFYGFVSLKQIVMGDALEQIGEKAFYKCTALETVTFGKNVKTVGEKAFYKCEALTQVVLSDSVERISNYAFYKCEALESLSLGKGLLEIGNYAFYGCRGLKELVLPTTIQSIGKQAFRNCKGLSAVILPKSLTVLSAHAFYGCSDLTLYSAADVAGEDWDPLWNSSYRPVIWSCTISEEGDYVLYFEKTATSITNRNASNTISNPVRAGYTCIGWDTNAAATKATYASNNLKEVTDGRKLYAIWVENAESNETN